MLAGYDRSTSASVTPRLASISPITRASRGRSLFEAVAVVEPEVAIFVDEVTVVCGAWAMLT